MTGQSWRLPADPPGRPLEYWLSPDLARPVPPELPSRLRELADTQGTLTAAWGAGIGAGAVFVLAGIFVAALGGGLAPLVVLGVLGATLVVLGVLGCRRVGSRLPDTTRTLIARGPGSARGGLSMLAFFGVALGAGVASVAPGQGKSMLTALIGTYVLIMLFLTACIVVPATIMGRSRETFRRKATNDTGFRALLEQDLVTWRPPVGNASYGPL
ncbi:hypothetical protein ACQHIV_39480 [Kribbella sp. GL6]|uniref:hypothetical protein n=1 Tax=Kribbella sp. GL6 TaxID=3419765 RepID=UPI003CFFBE11